MSDHLKRDSRGEYGGYVDSKKTVMSEELRKQWEEWLDENFDPGNYDAYKVKDSSILPYIDGHPQWVTETYMPKHLHDKLKLEQEKK